MESFILSWGYLAIFLFTVAEAACIPIPSEITLGLGGAMSSSAFVSVSGGSHRHLNLGLVIVIGVAGELIGSFVSYTVGRTGGRALVDRFGKYVLLTHRDLDRAEAWFRRRGDPAVLVARVVPVVRTFISFPAGVAEMPLVPFGIFTAIGVTVWVSLLASVGYALGSSWHSMVKGFGAASYVAAGLAVAAVAAAIVHRYRVVRAERATGAGTAPVGARGESEGAAVVGTHPADPD